MPNGWKKNAKKVSRKEKLGGSSKKSKKSKGFHNEKYMVGKVQTATLAKKYVKEDFNVKDWNSLKYPKSI